MIQQPVCIDCHITGNPIILADGAALMAHLDANPTHIVVGKAVTHDDYGVDS